MMNQDEIFRRGLETWTRGILVGLMYLAMSQDLHEGPVIQGECRGCGHEGVVTRRWHLCDECVRYTKETLGAS